MKILLYESISAKSAHLLLNNKYDELPSLLQMGLSMRNALENELKKIKNISLIIGEHSSADNLNSYLKKIGPEIDAFWIIAPETNNELIEAKKILHDKLWVGCEIHALNLTTNKTSTKKKLVEFDILNPDSNIYKNLPHFEYIVKPEDGAGCESITKYISYNKAKNSLLLRRAQGEKVILEKFIPGQNMSFSMLCSDKNFEVLSINKQLVNIKKNGKLSYDGICRINHEVDRNFKIKINTIAKKIGKAIPGLKGFVGVDFVLDKDSNICVIEINPRITCSYIGLSNYLNRSLAKEILEICL